jgi:hypothetical protein
MTPVTGSVMTLVKFPARRGGDSGMRVDRGRPVDQRLLVQVGPSGCRHPATDGRARGVGEKVCGDGDKDLRLDRGRRAFAAKPGGEKVGRQLFPRAAIAIRLRLVLGRRREPAVCGDRLGDGEIRGKPGHAVVSRLDHHTPACGSVPVPRLGRDLGQPPSGAAGERFVSLCAEADDRVGQLRVERRRGLAVADHGKEGYGGLHLGESREAVLRALPQSRQSLACDLRSGRQRPDGVLGDLEPQGRVAHHRTLGDLECVVVLSEGVHIRMCPRERHDLRECLRPRRSALIGCELVLQCAVEQVGEHGSIRRILR